MNFVLFCHSLLSDWNHGNAHFLRGVVTELVARGHNVRVYEPRDNWSLTHLLQEEGGAQALSRFDEVYPTLRATSHFYDEQDNIAALIEGADVVLVHEWSSPEIVAELGRLRRASRFKLLFHDTHHRAASARHEMSAFELGDYDGVLAFGNVIRDIYRHEGWAKRAWTWHEAADVRVFKPRDEGGGMKDEQPAAPSLSLIPPPSSLAEGDLIWIGNWGDGERTRELHEFLLGPVRDLKLKARVHGVRYPSEALAALREAHIEFGGWLPNLEAPEVFAKWKMTVHVPRGPYVQALPGIPTIRVFEALACGIPLVCAPWQDSEHLFEPGLDFWMARDGSEMKQKLQVLVDDPQARAELARHGLETIRARHTCAHRVDELMGILGEI